MEPTGGDLGPYLLGTGAANQYFVLFDNPGCKEGILSQVRGIFFCDLHSLDRNHIIHSSLDGYYYWIHVYDSRYSDGPFACRLRQQCPRLLIKSLCSTKR